MSRRVIHDLVLPLVIKRAKKLGIRILPGAVVRDRRLEEFFERRLAETLKVPGRFNKGTAKFCDDLEARLIKARREKREELERLIEILLWEYIDERMALAQIQQTGPPDRFSDLRKKWKESWRVA